MPTLTSAPSPKTFATAWTRAFAADVRAAAGRDGRLSVNEATKMSDTHADNAANYFTRTGKKTVSVEKLIGDGYKYAFATAARVAGADGKVSLVDARNLPADLKNDFLALRGK